MGGGNRVDIQASALEELVKKEVERLCPLEIDGCEVAIHSKYLGKRQGKRQGKQQVIEIFATFPLMPLDEQENLLASIEAALQSLLERQLGYRQEFLLNVSFKT